ncbi:MAG TPA: GTP cyclohydrolase I, partial [Casimicrobiaceae bacterium]|nr:GTP cyclohydrolase I [Casimicrobiaceae bacterium]
MNAITRAGWVVLRAIRALHSKCLRSLAATFRRRPSAYAAPKRVALEALRHIYKTAGCTKCQRRRRAVLRLRRVDRGARTTSYTALRTGRLPRMRLPTMKIDVAKIEQLTRELLRALGEDTEREGLVKTPERVAKAMAFLTSGYRTDLATLINGA